MTRTTWTIPELSNRLCRAPWGRRFLRSAWLAFRLTLAYPSAVCDRLFDDDGDRDDFDSSESHR